MQHSQHFRLNHRSFSHERRPCRYSFDVPENAHEALSAGDEVMRNDVVKKIIRLFSTPDIIQRYSEMDHPDYREQFFALLFSGSLRGTDRPEYAKVRSASDAKILESFPLLEKPEFPPTPAGNQALGKWLHDRLPNETFNKLPGHPNFENIGDHFRKTLQKACTEWNTNGHKPDDILVETTVAHYRHCRKKLDEILIGAGIKVRGRESESAVVSGDTLGRDEYLVLLKLLWDGSNPSLIRTAANDRIAGLRRLLATDAIRSTNRKLLAAYTDVSIGALGPQETLNRFGIVLGPILLRDYGLHIAGKLDKKTGVVNDSASTWIDHPEYAYRFLNGRIAATESNRQFLTSLRFYFVLTHEERKQDERLHGRPRLNEEDTKAILAMIVQALVRRERIILNSAEEREDFRKSERFDERWERRAGDAWEYIKDFSSHPMGSALLAISGYMVARSLYALIFKEKKDRKPGSPLWFFLILGGAALHFYRRHADGKAWWDTAGEAIGGGVQGVKNLGREAFGIEPRTPMDKKTLTEYWRHILRAPHPELKEGSLDERDMEACLFVLQQQKVSDIIRWYEDVSRQKRDAGSTMRIPPIPFSIRNRERFFQGRNSAAVAELFYGTLRRFFADRGATLPRDAIFDAAGGTGGDAERGLAFIRMKYMNSREYRVLMEKRLKIDYLRIDGKEYDLRGIPLAPADFTSPMHPTLRELKAKLSPEEYQKVLLGRMTFQEMTRADKTHEWKMSEVLLLEANPDILGMTGTAGARMGTMVERVRREAADILLPGAIIGPGVTVHPSVRPFLHNGIVLGPGSILPDITVLPPRYIAPGVVLPPAKIDPRASVPIGFVPPPGLVLPPTAVITDGSLILPAEIRPDPFISAPLPADTERPSGLVIPPGNVHPPGTQFPPESIPPGVVLPEADIDPSVRPHLPPGFVPPPGTRLPAKTVIQPGTVILPADVRRPPFIGERVRLPAGVLPPPGSYLAPDSFFPDGTAFPPSIVRRGDLPLPPPVIHPNVQRTLPPDFRPPPGLVLPDGAQVKPGTYIAPAYIER